MTNKDYGNEFGFSYRTGDDVSWANAIKLVEQIETLTQQAQIYRQCVEQAIGYCVREDHGIENITVEQLFQICERAIQQGNELGEEK